MEKSEIRILMIEDASADAELEIRELKRAGMRVSHRLVETEETFRAALRDFPPQLIISDFSMPHFDGMWALELARDLAPDVPFLFVSGTIGEEYAIRALKNGATDYVLKSNLVRLPAAVERALRDARDAVERRRAEAQLRLQGAALEAAANAIIITGRDGEIRWVNRAFCKLTGYSAEEVIGRNPRILNSGQQPPEFYKRIYETIGGGSTWHGEIVNRYKDGRLVTEEMTITPVRSANGEITEFIAIKQDISERKNQERRIERLNRILAVLSGINSAIVRIRERQHLFDEACRIAVEYGGFGIAWIGVVDADSLAITPVATAGVEGDLFLGHSQNSANPETPLGQGIIGRAVREKRAVFSNDLLSERSAGGARRQEALRRGYRSIIGLPLLVEGSVIASLSLFAKELNFFDDEEIKLLTELAGDISFALENMARQAQFEKLSRIRSVSSEINAAIVRIHDRRALLKEAGRIASEHGKFDLVWIGLVDAAKQAIVPVAWTGFSDDIAHRVSWKSISSAQGTLGEAMRTRKGAVRNDIEADLPTGQMRGEALARGCHSTVCLPLMVDDQVVALIALFAAGKGFFDEDELALLNEVTSDISLALQAIAQEEKVAFLSYYDALTGLPNRQLFVDRLNQQMRARGGEQRMVALILFDLERFRNINDTLGRHGGDELLRQIAQRVELAFGGKDYVAHIGADSFGAMIRGVRDAAEVAHAIESQVLACFREPFAVDGKDLRAAARAGVALFPVDGEDADTLYRNAEAALKKTKASGEAYLFYAPQMNARVAEQMKLESDLRDAMLQQQYVLHYQPKFELVSGRMAGMEALIRWNHPVRGLVPPGSFVSVLEETGLILEVGTWALKRAALDHAAWSSAGLKPPRIAVNVSPAQLRRKDFVDYLKVALVAVEGATNRIDIEITESMLMEDIGGSIAKLKEIQAMGLRVAIDDFGTGYSSLSYLARLPINSLKIDRSFVVQMQETPEQMAIVSTVISLARALNLKVVAEGVETEEQANLLRLLRCDEVQGFLFGRPVPPEEMEKLLRLPS